MRPTYRRLLVELHGGAGAVFGVLLFVVLFSGCWSLGSEALQSWARPPLADTGAAALPLNEILDRAQERGLSLDHVSLTLPVSAGEGILFCQGRGPCRLTLDPITGQPLSDRPALTLLKDLHKTAFIGFFGRVLISLLGIALFILCVGGLVLLGRRWRAPWHLRRALGTRRFVFELHGVIGSWFFPWLILFSLTGALSGLGALGTMMLSPVAYPGQPRQVFADLMGPPPPPASGQSLDRPPDLDLILEQDAKRFAGFTVRRVTISHGGDEAATVEVGGITRGLLSTELFEKHLYRMADGALLSTRSATDHGPWTRAFIAVQPLHFADYTWLGSGWSGWFRGLHLTAGLLACLLCVSGLHLWGQRRQTSSSWSRVAIPRLVEGSCGGLAAAAGILLLYVQARPLPLAAADWAGPVFWCVWGSAFLVSCLPFRRRPSLSLYLALAGCTCLLAVGLHLRAWLGAGSWPPLPVDLTLSFWGTLSCCLSWGLARSSVPRHPISDLMGDQNA